MLPVGTVGEPLTRFLRLAVPASDPAPPDEQLTFAVEPPSTDVRQGRCWSSCARREPATDRRSCSRADGREVRQADGSGAVAPFPGGPAATPPSSSRRAAADWNSDYPLDLVLAGAGGVRFLRQKEDGIVRRRHGRDRLGPEVLGADAFGVWAADIEMDGDLDFVRRRRKPGRRSSSATTATARSRSTHPVRGERRPPRFRLGRPRPATATRTPPFSTQGHAPRLRQRTRRPLPGPARPGTLGRARGARGRRPGRRRCDDLLPLGRARSVGSRIATDERRDVGSGRSRRRTTGGGRRVAGSRAPRRGPGQQRRARPHRSGPSGDADLARRRRQAGFTLDRVARAAGLRRRRPERRRPARPGGLSPRGGAIRRAEDAAPRPITGRSSGPGAAKAVGDGRINSFGIGGEVQVRAGLLVQKQVIAGPVAPLRAGRATRRPTSPASSGPTAPRRPSSTRRPTTTSSPSSG